MDPAENIAQNAAPPTAVADNRDLERRLSQQWREAQPWNYTIAETRSLCQRFYGLDQWDAKQKAQLAREGRPPVVVPRIFKAVNNVSGAQRDARLRWKAYPKGENDVLTAAGVTRGAAYLEDATDFKFTESRVFKDTCIQGSGWVEVGYDETDPTREAVFADYVPDDEMVVDPWGKQDDLSDYRYLIRRKEVDYDIARAQFPGKEAILRAAMVDRQREQREKIGGDYGNRDDGTYANGYVGNLPDNAARERVCLREHHYWEVEETLYVLLPDGEKLDYDPEDEATFQALQMGGQVMKGKKRCFYVAFMAGDRLLETKKSELPLDRYRLARLPGFRGPDGKLMGLVEPMIWPQKEINVNRSRANESMRSRWLIYAKGSLGGAHTQDQVAQMLARGNFALEVNDPAGVQLGSDKADLAAWMEMEQQAAKDLDDVVGLNEAAYGDKSNEKSGKAIERRVQQQSLNIGELWDNWRHFRLQVGRMMLACAIKFWTKEKWARVIEQTVISEHEEAMRQAQMMGTPLPPQADLSWVGRSVVGIGSLFRYDLKLEDQAETTTERQATMQQAIELVGMLPDPAKMAIAPDVIRMSDFQGKDEMASKAEAAMAPAPMPGMPPGPMPPPGMDPNLLAPQPPAPPVPGGPVLPPDAMLAG